MSDVMSNVMSEKNVRTFISSLTTFNDQVQK